MSSINKELQTFLGAVGKDTLEKVRGQTRLSDLLQNEILKQLAQARRPSDIVAHGAVAFMIAAYEQSGQPLIVRDEHGESIENAKDWMKSPEAFRARSADKVAIYNALGLKPALRKALADLMKGVRPAMPIDTGKPPRVRRSVVHAVAGRTNGVSEDVGQLSGGDVRPLSDVEAAEFELRYTKRPGGHAIVTDEVLRAAMVIDESGQRLPVHSDPSIAKIQKDLWNIGREGQAMGEQATRILVETALRKIRAGISGVGQ